MLGKSQIKYIQSLGQKKVRDEEGVFIAEGPKIVAELLESDALEISELFALPDWIATNGTSVKAIKITEINENDLGKISQLSTPNKVVALIKKPAYNKSIPTKAALSLVLDTIQDPGNLGTIIRIADWFGIKQIICSKTCADIYNPKTVQSTMGSIARVGIVYTDLVEWLKQHKDVPVYAAALEGRDVTAMKKITEGLLVIGNESKGISNEIFELIDVKVTIPRIGKAESLNAAVATGIILSHVALSER
ncbi:TrmH family RNA methyltransferase [Terrimonas pollutisoli]|uniref:TrmH family RNA methyltransferase n=1 Tax=Terrimonas pollutisoli TaxID=3034147 RepID=UPI0023ECB869|nr:RNA methyltransferase [Terrimonas sp. H1YJ31]